MVLARSMFVAKSPAESAANPGAVSAPPPIDLRDPVVAGILAWAIPGAGHWYQGRRTKALLFFVCIVGTFFYGLWLGGGRVVYASWGRSQDEKRLPYVCQVGAGLIAMPAVIQSRRYADPQYRAAMEEKENTDGRSFGEWFMAPPVLRVRLPNGWEPSDRDPPNELDVLNYKLNRRFELGTIYTMVAGLLNILVIFDAIGGPAYGMMMARRTPGGDTGPPKTTPAPS